MFCDFETFGLILSFTGAVALTLAAQYGTQSGWGGSLETKVGFWSMLNNFGWIFLSTGFFLQLLKKITVG